MAALCKPYVFENRHGLFSYFIFMPAIIIGGFGIEFINNAVDLASFKFFFGDLCIETEVHNALQFETFIIFLLTQAADQALGNYREGCINIQCKAFAKQGMVAFIIYC